jgi:hypothetical protein
MSVSLSLKELLAACEWVSGGEAAALDCEAYVSRKTGSIHWRGEGVDEELPEDIEDGSQYIAVPHKSEFDLGRSLAIRFAEEHLPQHQEAVYEFFRKRGAYAQFKSLLSRAGQLDAWHEYELSATEISLREWCNEAGFELGA